MFSLFPTTARSQIIKYKFSEIALLCGIFINFLNFIVNAPESLTNGSGDCQQNLKI